ncbi:NAD-dependent succinate-semialdehyde dehydrogenase [Gordonia humi]|uniref:Succinate-semialdehyde dehydrogenase/glutarate-semialdehyde dehydrogenase n=1 Tax=Gordonia humi TaxID=686429 RepID=A0A840F522_9ACTN|nr:NAD-dependent succinate-semialdehyde dehydrogenase [Gordonia humi]MBB4137538.1 succinate-semialdehyde dehydrogenase/glutarate-semialdehyde dehydrogenase [Gordonia humi]
MTDKQTLLSSVPTGLWIDGASVPAASGKTFPVTDPATGDVLVEIADAGVDDVRRAFDIAVTAGRAWATTPPRERGEILRAAFEAVIARTDDFAMLMTLEMGKILSESVGEVNYGAEFLRWFSEEAVRIHGHTSTAPAGNGEIVVVKEPVGPVLAVTPWNFPLAMGTRKIGPALAAGCPIVVKPARDTPLTMLLLAQVFADAGLPPGVLTVLQTTHSGDVSSTLMADHRLRKISFTGSTGVGRVLIRQSADQILRTSMELGGNAPFLVFDDADLDAAVEGAMAAKMRNGGEACTSANRFIVQNGIRPAFTEALTARLAAMRVGPGYDADSDLGPIVNAKQVDHIAGLVDEAVTAGATLHTGGRRVDGPGSFYEPTLLTDVPAGCAILTEEIFGPVIVISGFDTDDEAITRANDTDYGLASYFFTRDLDRAKRVARALDYGLVGVNRGVISDPAAPFGGVKHSGIGVEGGFEGIEEYLDTKYIALTS